MRVLHVYKTYYPDTLGGIEQVIFHLAQGLPKHGVQAEVLTVSRRPHPERIAVADHTVHRARSLINVASTPLSLAFIGALKRLARKADLVHYQFPWPMMDVAQRYIGSATPYVVSYQSDVVRQRRWMPLYEPWMHHFLGGAARLIATSPAYAESSPVLQRYRDKVAVIPIGIDEAALPAASDAHRQHWRQRISGPYLLFVGVLRYYKGLHVLLEALRGTGMRLVIAGQGPMEAPLRAQAQQLPPSQVQFVGVVSDADKAALLQDCVAVAFPSHLRAEAFGITLVEGARFGRPLVSCEIGTGTSFINQHGHTGWVVQPDDPAALRQALQSLWSAPDLAQTLGCQARERYLALFRAETMVERHVALYHDVLRSRASACAVNPHTAYETF